MLATTQEDAFVDEEAEDSVVGTLLCSPERLEDVSLKAEDFASARRGLVFAAMQALQRRGVAITGLTVAQQLKDSSRLADAGGAPEIMRLEQRAMQLLPGYGRGFAEQVARVSDMARRRRLRAVLADAMEGLRSVSRPVEEVAFKAAASLTELGTAGGTNVPTAADALERAVSRVEAAQRGESREKYIRTGVTVWDRFVGGLPRRRVTVLAAHPGVGKSGLLDTIALSLAAGGEGRPPERPYYGHLEDEAESFADRHLAEHSGLSLRELGSAGLSREQMESIVGAQARLYEAMERIRLDDQRGLSIQDLVSRARYYARRDGVSVVLVDHTLQLIPDPQRLHEKVWVVMQALAELAHKENVAVLLAHHLADPEDKKTDAKYVKPTMQMLAGGRMVERVARVVVGMRACPPPRAPAEPKRGAQAQPKAKKGESAEAVLATWQAQQAEAERKYRDELERWKQSTEVRRNRVLLAVMKANEMPTGQEFWMERVPHAALFHRDRGAAKEEN